MIGIGDFATAVKANQGTTIIFYVSSDYSRSFIMNFFSHESICEIMTSPIEFD